MIIKNIYFIKKFAQLRQNRYLYIYYMLYFVLYKLYDKINTWQQRKAVKRTAT